MRSTHPLNDNWLFTPRHPNTEERAPERVSLPHTNVVLPHHAFSSEEYCFTSRYVNRFTLPEPLNGRRLHLDFEGAMLASTVSFNGAQFPEHRGGYVPFSYDISDLVTDGENTLEVILDSSERRDIPPFGNVVDYLTFGGIYREVSLRYVPPVSLEDVFVRCDRPLAAERSLSVTLEVANHPQSAVSAMVELKVSRDGVVYSTTSAEELVPASRLHPLEFTVDGRALELWHIDSPTLYDLEATITYTSGGRKWHDTVRTRFGVREARFDVSGAFLLNGAPLKLRGLNRHQTYPYIGAAAPKRLQELDAEILKHELGCHIVRTSHYPQSRHFLRRCDEIGLLVFEEIPGWQHIGDEDWKALALRDVDSMIRRDRNHPSIVLWGVRINESLDDDAFYRRTNDLAHALDPTRQTGGVRYFQESTFLEDVFTFNDFSDSVAEPVHTPHLVTEFNGHMFPTKSWDCEERLVEHALRHAAIQERAASMPRVAGAIGWCAFDYNTHREFGSGESTCFHGVMDIFRLPKYAAHFYESQQSPSSRVVLHPATIWSMGDRSGGGNEPLVVFSNCDKIDVYVGTTLHGTFSPEVVQYPNLPHPPFVVPGLSMILTWGKAFGDLRVVGYLHDEPVIERRVAAGGLPESLLLRIDHPVLDADGRDMTRLVFTVADRYGNRLPYATSVVSFEVETLEGEPPHLIGENPFPLIGGYAALFVRAPTIPGRARIHARTSRHKSSVEIEFKRPLDITTFPVYG